jgi:copper chaperone CopZ
MSEIKLTIGGMNCQHCVGRVKKAIDAVVGVEDSAIEVGSASVKIDDGKTTRKAVEQAITGAGYTVQ